MSYLPRFEQKKGYLLENGLHSFKRLLNPNFKPVEKRYGYTDKRTDRKTDVKRKTRTGE